MPLSGKTKSAYEWYKQREQELQTVADVNGGQLPRQDYWRLAYYRQPYLLLESDDVVIDRFVDVFTCGFDITAEGKIAPTLMMKDDGRLTRLFGELIEETNWRGILTRDSVNYATAQMHEYFKNGTPLGVRMFRGMPELAGQWLLKFSQKDFVADMYERGRFRISPASYYAKGNHIRAVRDLEIARTYRLKAIDEAIAGANSVEFKGRRIPITDGVVLLQSMMDDYYLFSTCSAISRRMPTDFDADAVLIIKDKSTFVRRLKDAMLREMPTWEFLEGSVYYFDPYNDIPKDANQEFWKHIAYAYQREHRCVLRPRMRQSGHKTLEPLFVELGALDDISEMITT